LGYEDKEKAMKAAQTDNGSRPTLATARQVARALGWAMIFALMLSVLGCDSNSTDEAAEQDEQAVEQEEESAEEYDPYAGWCHGHDLPESYCTKCHPELVEKYKEAGDWCDEHEFPKSACPECNPMDPPEEG
jgi:membrane fusion protein, heavy metal efflux system